jgi:hypothetical protein
MRSMASIMDHTTAPALAAGGFARMTKTIKTA